MYGVCSAGPTRYGSVVQPDHEVIAELNARGTVFRTDLTDTTCRANPAKMGPDSDGAPGGCDNVRATIVTTGAVQVLLAWRRPTRAAIDEVSSMTIRINFITLAHASTSGRSF
jgi:hypothetical protein